MISLRVLCAGLDDVCMNDVNAESAAPGALPQWDFAFGAPAVRGVLRATPEDFAVDEELGFAPDGDGDHALLHVRKRETNTEWLAREIARFAGVKPVAVGFAGLKDRHAVTTQWFSVHLPGAAQPDWGQFQCEGVAILAVERHRRKLHRGELRGNRFRLVARALTGNLAALETRLQQVVARGVPNYFGEQRFGIDGGNLAQASAMFEKRTVIRDRHKRGLYISAARSYLFNEVLAARVRAGTWDRALPGEVLMLDGTQSFVQCDSVDSTIERRVAAGELQPTGPMWGRGRALSGGEVLALEQAVLAPHAVWRDGLEHVGLEQERRPLRLWADGLRWSLDSAAATLTLEFALPAGAYATTVLREVVASGK